MSDNIDDGLSFEQIDIFREIGNIGAGNAATSLARILNKQITMSVPEVQVVPFNDIVNILDGPESLVVGLLVDMSGDLSGYVLLILELGDAFEMADIALGNQNKRTVKPSIENMTELESSAITEMANILVGSYLSAICTLTGLNIIPSVPYMAMDMVGAIISIVAIEYGKIGDSVLFMKTKFSDVEKDMSGHFFLIPDYKSYKILMDSLGMGS